MVQREERQLEDDSGREDAEPAQEGAEDCGRRSFVSSSRFGDASRARTWVAGEREDAEIDGKVEVGPGEGLEDGKAEEKVARLDPAWLDRVLSQEGNDDWAAAKATGREDEGARVGQRRAGDKRESFPGSSGDENEGFAAELT